MGLSLATMSPRVGFGTPSTLMVLSMGATVSVKHLNDFSTFGQTLRLYTRTQFSIGTFQRWVSFALSLLSLFDLVHCCPNK